MENYLISYDFLGYDINNIFHQKSVQDNPNEVCIAKFHKYILV